MSGTHEPPSEEGGLARKLAGRIVLDEATARYIIENEDLLDLDAAQAAHMAALEELRRTHWTGAKTRTMPPWPPAPPPTPREGRAPLYGRSVHARCPAGRTAPVRVS